MFKKIYFTLKLFSQTPVNFGGITGRALAVILKLNFWKSCDHHKKAIQCKKKLCFFYFKRKNFNKKNFKNFK
jgi:hypothetical protein